MCRLDRYAKVFGSRMARRVSPHLRYKDFQPIVIYPSGRQSGGFLYFDDTQTGDTICAFSTIELREHFKKTRIQRGLAVA